MRKKTGKERKKPQFESMVRTSGVRSICGICKIEKLSVGISMKKVLFPLCC